MSSVSSTDSGLENYYHQTMKDLDREIRTETKRNREKREEEISAIDKRYKEALLKKDQEHEEAVKSIRANGNDALTRERERHEAALNELKDQTYNNKGISGSGADGAVEKHYHQAFEDLQNNLDTETKRHRETEQKTAEELQQKYQEESIKKEGQIREAVRNIKEAANSTIDREKEQYQAEIENIKNQNYNNKGQFSGWVPPEVHKKTVQDLYQSAELQQKNNLKNTQNREAEFHQRMQDVSQKSESQIKNLTRHQSEEIRNLESQIKDLTTAEQKAEKAKSEEIAAMVRDNENNQRNEIRKLEQNFNGSVDKLHDELNEKDSYYSQRNRDSLKDKEAYFADIIRNQNNESRHSIAELQSNFKRQIDDLEKERKIDAKRSDERLENSLNTANKQREVILEQQAKAYEDTIGKLRKNADAEVKVLEKALTQQKTSPDSKLVSPLAEESIRRSVIKEYEKTLNSEIDKNKANHEHMRQKFNDDYHKLADHFEDKETSIRKTNANNEAITRAQYFDTIQETEEHANLKIHEQQSDNNREKEVLIRQFSNAMERQKREFDHIFESSRADAESKLATFRQEAAVNLKVQARAFNARQNELLREYEKKLADQKTEYEFQIEDLKAQNKIDIRDLEKKSRQELQQQANEYEMRLAQLKDQTKERERYIAQGYQDELDRTRRSYELLSKKKS